VYVWELLGQLLRDMRGRKLRTVLAVSGIAWGTAAVVLLLAIGRGFQAASSKAMSGMGDHLLVVWPSRTTRPFAGMQPGRPVRLKSADVLQLCGSLPQVRLCSPEMTNWDRVLVFGARRFRAPVGGVVPAYELIRNMVPEQGGRFLNQADVDQHRRVVFVGDQLRQKLFGGQEAVGQTVLLDGRPFVVVGSLHKKIQSSSYSGPDADKALVPYTTFIDLWGDWNVSDFLLQPEPLTDSEPLRKALYGYLGQKLRFDPEDEGALSIWDTVRENRFVDWFFWGLQALLGLSGALTLGAGGIGVANVMFLIVRERTREIGVRMAVGAQDRHILGQVLLEALLIVALGGALGFALSGLVIGLLQLAPLPDWLGRPRFSPQVGLAAGAILAVVGLAAGLFPARRASRLDPVKALGF
jgi:putative ABC transport system permease protein